MISEVSKTLSGEGMPVLNWALRVKIALGAARGIAYLHEDCKLLKIFFFFLFYHFASLTLFKVLPCYLSVGRNFMCFFSLLLGTRHVLAIFSSE